MSGIFQKSKNPGHHHLHARNSSATGLLDFESSFVYNLQSSDNHSALPIQNSKPKSKHIKLSTNLSKLPLNLSNKQTQDTVPSEKHGLSQKLQKRSIKLLQTNKLSLVDDLAQTKNDQTVNLVKSSFSLPQSEENQNSISIRTFNSKFIKELNSKQNQGYRKNRKKLLISKYNKESLEKLISKNKKSVKPYNQKKQMHEIYYNQIRIISEFKNNILHGETEIYYPNGAKFIGKYQQGMRISGYFDFNNGYSYEGGFLSDNFHGEGKLTLPNGKIFSGDWVENQLVGKVTIKYPSEDLYYGEVFNFKKHGKGHLFFKTGEKFVGQFKNGNITGFGEYFISDECVGKGYWANGELIMQVQANQQLESDLYNLSHSNIQMSGYQPWAFRQSKQAYKDIDYSQIDEQFPKISVQKTTPKAISEITEIGPLTDQDSFTTNIILTKESAVKQEPNRNQIKKGKQHENILQNSTITESKREIQPNFTDNEVIQASNTKLKNFDSREKLNQNPKLAVGNHDKRSLVESLPYKTGKFQSFESSFASSEILDQVIKKNRHQSVL